MASLISYSLSFVVIFSSLGTDVAVLVHSVALYFACSAAREFGVGEDSAAVESVGVLRDVGNVQVVLGLTQSLHDLGVHIVLCVSLGRVIELLPLVGISILLALPHEGRFLGGDLEDLWVERLNDRVAGSSLLVDDLLTVSCHLVIEVVAGREIVGGRRCLLHNCSLVHTPY